MTLFERLKLCAQSSRLTKHQSQLHIQDILRRFFKSSTSINFSQRRSVLDFGLKNLIVKEEKATLKVKLKPLDKFFRKDNTLGYGFALSCFFGGLYVAFKASFHTIFRKDLQKVLQLVDENGEKKKIPPKLERLIQQVADDLRLKNDHIKSLDAFLNSSDEKTSSLGSFVFNRGFLAGFPKIILFESTDEVQLDKLTVGKKNLSPEQQLSKSGQDLKNSVVLSENAKKFLIARELNRGLLVIPGVEEKYMMIFLPMMYTLHVYVYNHLNLVSASRISRLVWAGISLLFPTVVYITARNIQKDSNEHRVDVAACSLGPTYAAGGIEWYSKLITRHLAMRDLLPNDQGKQQYNLAGEEFQPLIINKHRPLSLRKADCHMSYTSKVG